MPDRLEVLAAETPRQTAESSQIVKNFLPVRPEILATNSLVLLHE